MAVTFEKFYVVMIFVVFEGQCKNILVTKYARIE